MLKSSSVNKDFIILFMIKSIIFSTDWLSYFYIYCKKHILLPWLSGKVQSNLIITQCNITWYHLQLSSDMYITENLKIGSSVTSVTQISSDGAEVFHVWLPILMHHNTGSYPNTRSLGHFYTALPHGAINWIQLISTGIFTLAGSSLAARGKLGPRANLRCRCVRFGTNPAADESVPCVKAS